MNVRCAGGDRYGVRGLREDDEEDSGTLLDSVIAGLFDDDPIAEWK